MSKSETNSHFGAYSKYYDLLYQDKDYEKEVVYISDLLSRYGDGSRRILELGCGTGRHAELMVRNGFDVTGVELSESMLEQAKQRAALLRDSKSDNEFNVHPGDARTFSLDETFDAVISLFHVVSYQTTNKDVNQMFNTAAKHLETGGLFVFDVWYGPAVLTSRPAVRVKRMEDDEMKVLRIAEPEIDLNCNRVDVGYTILVTDKRTDETTRLTETHPMRYYFTPELELLAEAHGFRCVHSEEWMTGDAPSDQTWGVTFVVKKAH